MPDPLSALFGVVVPRAVDAIDLNEVLDNVDLDRLIGRIDMNALVAGIDTNALIEQIDMNELMARIDTNALLEHIDMNELIERVDLNVLLTRIDIAGIIKRAQVDAIVTATAAGLGRRLLDLFRRALVGIDVLATRAVARILHREREYPPAHGTVTGALAGAATRLTAFLLDLVVIAVTFVGGLAIGLFMVSLFVGHHIGTNHGARWYLLGFVVFALIYQWVCLVVAGRTPGKALAGLRVTAPDGSPIVGGAATRRVLVYPFSFILGLGLIGIVLGRRHRALHDIAAPSLVRYDWGDRPAEMPAPITGYLQRQHALPNAAETAVPAATAPPAGTVAAAAVVAPAETVVLPTETVVLPPEKAAPAASAAPAETAPAETVVP
jgi:uncharacterized RDD family membrane protein YckC